MFKFHAYLAALTALATASLRRSGWLDRVVMYHKSNFIEELKQLAPVDLQATIEEAPPGYVDSPSWDLDSVARLLTLIGESESARPAREGLRRMLAPTRRFMSKQKSYKFFPSLMEMHKSDLYYDQDSDIDIYEELVPPNAGEVLNKNSIVLVRNPVEARLPSARISVKLLRDILEARATAARRMPSSKKTTSILRWTTQSHKPTAEIDKNTNEPGAKTEATSEVDNFSISTTVDTEKVNPRETEDLNQNGDTTAIEVTTEKPRRSTKFHDFHENVPYRHFTV